MADWTDFLANAVGTLVGVAAGIPAALWVERRLRSSEAKEQEEHQKERRAKLLAIASDAAVEATSILNWVGHTRWEGRRLPESPQDHGIWDVMRTDFLKETKDRIELVLFVEFFQALRKCEASRGKLADWMRANPGKPPDDRLLHTLDDDARWVYMRGGELVALFADHDLKERHWRRVEES